MNREIKFRAKGHTDNQWLYGSLATDRNGLYVILPTEDWSKGDTVFEETIGQFTGLKDKNGKEIYEGDVIKSPLNNIVEVQFGYNGIVAKNANIKTLDSYACYGWIVKNVRNGIIEFLDNTFLEGEVIGNIHDNKDLLNKE